MDGLIFDPEKHQYFLNGLLLPSVTQILADMGFINRDFFTEQGKTRGSFVHLATELDDKDELDEESLDDALLPYLTAWRLFKRESGLQIESIEKPVASGVYQFAGTLDRIGMLNGHNESILDIKSGAVSSWVGLQLAGYEIAENKKYKRYAVQLMDTGKYKLHQFNDRSDRQIFLSAVACWHWINNQKKGK